MKLCRLWQAILSSRLVLLWRQWIATRQLRTRAILQLLAKYPGETVDIGKFYARTGQCNQCGQCCESIHLMHRGRYIEHPWHFALLKWQHRDFRHFEPIGQTADGLVFRCTQLKADKTCGVYADRPTFCRRYPSEEIKLYGSCLPQDCSYGFEAILPFQQYMTSTPPVAAETV